MLTIPPRYGKMAAAKELIINLRAGFSEVVDARRDRLMVEGRHVCTFVTYPDGEVYIRALTAFPTLATVLFERSTR